MFKVMWASWNQSYLELCDYDTGKLAVHYGWCRVGMGLCQIVTNPIYSAISDSVWATPCFLRRLAPLS